MTFDKTNQPHTQDLLKAAEKGDAPFVIEAIEQGYDVNTKNSFNENLFFLACKSGNEELCLFLLKNNADIHQLNTGNQSALHAACISGNLNIVKTLIDLGLSAKPLKKIGSTPLSLAFKYQHAAIVEFFMEHQLIEPDDLKTIRFYHGNNDSNLQLIENLLARNPSLGDHLIDHIFSQLIRISDLSSMKLMLKKFPVIKTHWGIYFPDLIDEFRVREKEGKLKPSLIQSETFKKYSDQILFFLTKNKSLKCLLDQGLSRDSLDSTGQSLLHYAATFQLDEYEDVSHLNGLLDMQYPIDLLNAQGQTSLQKAIEKGMFFHALFLIYRGANIALKDAQGRSTIDYAHEFCADGCEADDRYNVELKQDLIALISAALPDQA